MNSELRDDVINLIWKHSSGRITIGEAQVRVCNIINIVEEAPRENKEEKQASAQQHITGLEDSTQICHCFDNGNKPALLTDRRFSNNCAVCGKLLPC